MLAMTRLRLLGTLIIAAALAALLALAAFSSDADATHSWGKYHWARTTNPFTLKLGDNVSSEWDSYLIAASGPARPYPLDPSPTFNSENDWSDSSVLDTTVVPGRKDPRYCRPTSGQVEVCNEKYGTNGWLGLAQIWTSGYHIVQGTSKLNDTYFERDRYNKPAWRHLVLCQEVGHTFGLHHQDENHANTNLGTCMDYTNDPTGTAGTNGTLSNEYPNQHDYEQLEFIYGAHLDGSTTVSNSSAASQMPPAANRGDFNSRDEWGQKVQESPNGQLELWERGFGNGKRVFTFVIRA